MNRTTAITILVALLACSQSSAFAYDWPAWLRSAPLNTDSSVVGFPSAMGLAKAWRYLAYLLNFAVLAGLLYALAKDEADYSHFIEVYLGIVVGGIVLSFVLSRFLHAFALLPVIALTGFLLMRFCGLTLKRAALVAVVFHAYQIAYILAYRGISGTST